MTEEPLPSYRRRNMALAVIVGLVAVAAIVRIASTARPESDTHAPANVTAGAPQMAQASAVPPNQSPASGSAVGAPLTVEVAYAGPLDTVPETAKVYVFVRPVGERMPLGVQTYSVRDLPAAVEFSATTQQTGSVEVVARLSMSGAVMLQPGDLEVVSDPLMFGKPDQRVALTLGGQGVANASGKMNDRSPHSSGGGALGASGIPVHLALAPGIELPPDTVVFLIARAVDGNPAPLAVKRFTVSDLPMDVSLSDADAMVPGRSISAAAKLELVARASINGSVKPLPGDYEGNSGVLEATAVTAPIELLIDHVL